MSENNELENAEALSRIIGISVLSGAKKEARELLGTKPAPAPQAAAQCGEPSVQFGEPDAVCREVTDGN